MQGLNKVFDIKIKNDFKYNSKNAKEKAAYIESTLSEKELK